MSFDINKPYKMNSGHRIILLAQHAGQLVGWTSDGVCLKPRRWTLEGVWDDPEKGCSYKTNGSAYDLVNIPEKRTVKVWINLYPNPAEDSGHIMHHIMHLSRKAADAYATDTRVACIEREITYEVGEGLP